MVNTTMQSNPDDVVALWFHRNDTYEDGPWGNWRKGTFYNYGYIPYTVIDAKLVSSPGVFQNHIDSRLAIPTDVTIELGATEIAADTILVTAEVCMEATGVAETMHIHIFDVLDYYPTSPTWYRNCVRQGFNLGEISMAPGACVGVQQEIVFDGGSMASQDNIGIAAFVEAAVDVAPGDVHQAVLTKWPLPETEHPVFSAGFEGGTLEGWTFVN